MGERSPSQQFAAQRVLHDVTVQRLMQRVYEQRLINNVERGAYVECMIELAFSERHPAWRLTGPWSGWDLEDRETRARIQIKQSAALNPWSTKPGSDESDAKPRSRTFSIKPSNGYWSADGAIWAGTPMQRQADIYVFAWHPMADWDIADHRRPDQWKFFVVAERDLPQDEPLAKAISISKLTKRASVRCCDYETLADTVVDLRRSLQSLRVQQRFYKGNDGNLMQHWTICEVLAVASRHTSEVAYVDAHAMAPLANRQTETDARSRRFRRVEESLPGQGSIYEHAWKKLRKGGGYPNSAAFLDYVWPKRRTMLLCESDPLTVGSLRSFERDQSVSVRVEAGDWRTWFRRGFGDLSAAPLALLSFDPYLYNHHEPVKRKKAGNMYPEDLRLVVSAVESLNQSVILQVSTYSANDGNGQPFVMDSIDSILGAGGFCRAVVTRANGHMMSLIYSRGIDWSGELAGLAGSFDAWLAKAGG